MNLRTLRLRRKRKILEQVRGGRLVPRVRGTKPARKPKPVSAKPTPLKVKGVGVPVRTKPVKPIRPVKPVKVYKPPVKKKKRRWI